MMVVIYLRVSSHSNIPDLEGTGGGGGGDFGYGHRPGGSAFARPRGQPVPVGIVHPRGIGTGSATAINIDPHPEVFEKKREVLQELAVQKQAVKEAKGLFELSSRDV